MLKIEKHPNPNLRDDVYKCKDINKSPVWIYEEGAPREFRFICCEDHLKQIVKEGITYFGEEFKKEILELISPNAISPQQIKDLDLQVEDYKSQYNAEKILNGVLKSKVAELELEVKKVKSYVQSQKPRKPIQSKPKR